MNLNPHTPTPSSLRRQGSSSRKQSQSLKARFQLAPALRYGLAGMTMFELITTAHASEIFLEVSFG